MTPDFIRSVYRSYVGLSMGMFSRYPVGTNIFDREWDVLLILDTCRVDALREVEPEYDFLTEDTIKSIWSVGSSSSEWIAQTFTKDRRKTLKNSAYISGNSWAERIIENRLTPEDHVNAWPKWGDWNVALPSDFQLLEQAWKYEPQNRYGLNPGHPHPRYITDRIIDTMRSKSPDRLVAHYSQPHSPWTANARAEDREVLKEHEENPFSYLRNGGDEKLVWETYLDDLRMVLDDIELLLENIDADKVILSADHGEAFGEFGIYGHGIGVPHPHIKRVPWAETSASDGGTYQPSLEPSQESTRTAEEQLEALGYV